MGAVSCAMGILDREQWRQQSLSLVFSRQGVLLFRIMRLCWPALGKPRLLHRIDVSCCCMPLLLRPGTFHTWFLCRLDLGKNSLLHSIVVACCCMRLRLQPGTFHSAYAGLLRQAQLDSQHSCGMLFMRLLLQPGAFHSAYAGLLMASPACFTA